jgi:multidrug efflux pump
MIGLIEAAFTRARLVVAALIFILISGWIAWREIPKEAEPDVRIPIIYVSIRHEGISPDDAERLLVRPMEQKLRGIEGVKEMRSTAFEGGAFVIMEFDAGFNGDRALQDVRDKVDQAKGDLPADAKEPTIHEINFSLFPVLVVTLSGAVPERTLLKIARDLRDKIEAIPAILEAKIVGTRDELVEVVIDPVLIESYGLSAAEIIPQITRNNQVIAAGSLDTGEGRFSLKVPGLIASVPDILSLPLVVKGDQVVRVRDVAEVRRTFKDRQTYARVDGRPSVALEISKRTGENIIDTAARVRQLVDAERALWPENMVVGYAQDKSDQIKEMLRDLENNLLLAVVLVLIVVLATLGWRSTTLVAIAVPGSFLAGILMLAGMGLTINLVVLFGLIFASGNVVDGAIVVTEYADARMAEGMKRREAYQLAARRMAWPIIASTATQLAAFLPLMFWPGVVGEFMKYLPISQFVTMLAALAMALLFVPVLGALFGRAGGGAGISHAVQAIESGQVRQLRSLTGFYVRILDAAIRRPARVLFASIIGLLLIAYAYGQAGHGVEFFPKVEPDRSMIVIQARGNLSIEEQDVLVREIEAQVLDVQRRRNEFASIYVTSGKPVDQVRDLPEDTIGVIQLEFGEWHGRRKADVILEEIRGRMGQYSGVVAEFRREEAGPPVGKAIQIELSARDPELIEPVMARLVAKMQQMEGLRNIEDSRPLPGIQWELAVDRAQAAKFGADVSAVGSIVKLVTNGLKITTYRPIDSDEEIDIVVRYPLASRNIAQLDTIRVQTALGPIPVGNMVVRKPVAKTGSIRRTDSRRVMTAKADVAPGVLAEGKVAELQAWIAAESLPAGIQARFKGEDEEQRKAQAFLSKAFAGAIFLIFLILLAQFNSVYRTLLILSAVVMSTLGVLIGLLVAGKPFGIVMSGIGVVALAGIVVANNIVLIDTYVHLRRQGKSPYDAALITGAERVRPVLLTALNNVLGLLPLTFGINVDFLERDIAIGAPATQWWLQLSQAIVFGMGFATVLTLILTPCALILEANVTARFAAWKARFFPRARLAQPPAE